MYTCARTHIHVHSVVLSVVDGDADFDTITTTDSDSTSVSNNAKYGNTFDDSDVNTDIHCMTLNVNATLARDILVI